MALANWVGMMEETEMNKPMDLGPVKASIKGAEYLETLLVVGADMEYPGNTMPMTPVLETLTERMV